MRAVLQRVKSASVALPDGERRAVGRGLVIFLGVSALDTAQDAAVLAERASRLRVFADPSGAREFDLSVQDIQGDVLIVSQFTLYADTRKGRRPDFSGAAPSNQARPLYQTFVQEMKIRVSRLATGEFGSHMQVHLENDGPVTILLDSAP
jgi:D-aminoacyl-tRNA deacylase